MAFLPRASGILVHPTSLPSPYGIGELGPSAAHLLDLLSRARQQVWQILPIHPTGIGDSPYAGSSAFAGNPLLISLDRLVEDGLLDSSDLQELKALPAGVVDYDRVRPLKRAALRRAYERWAARSEGDGRERLQAFCEQEAAWLGDFALFTALHHRFETAWTDWDPALRDREPGALGEARRELAGEVEFETFQQLVFFQQWAEMRERARALGVRILGDIPIFVAHDSADVWVHRSIFKLDATGSPHVMAGVPPDYFSETGQLWGNPVYDWEALRDEGYRWWVDRFRHMLRLLDALRVDHFRGFQAAWEVPAGSQDARSGHWVPGPGAAFFHALEQALGQDLPIVAEDLGMLTEDVYALLAEVGFPGMKILQFAFSGDPNHIYLPHTFRHPNWVIYTGTHDNDTTRGWYDAAPEKERDFARRYLGASGDDVTWACIKLALSSIADLAVVPLQDVLDLGSEARMNAPGRAEGNWRWRATPDQLHHARIERLGEMTWLLGRAPELSTRS